MSRSSDAVTRQRRLDAAIEAFRAGNPILLYDATDREGEVDFVYPASAITPADVAQLRNDAGGLVCVALADSVCDAWGLPFLSEAIDHPATETHDLAYDDRSSFSLTVNHRETFTGITDEDRALTISELGAAAADPESIDFSETFRSPGHVNLLRAASGLLETRRGHTEFAIALAEAADIAPAVVVCEMLDSETGGALSPAAARAYAERHGYPYLEGTDVVGLLQ
ncbi:MAG: 3,4-dihydroxy-2-butanone-4-phosphate synthase [Natronomonas sp.]